jgi:hypothetical protein
MHQHAIERMNNRINSVGITIDQKHLSMLCKKFPRGKHYIRVASLGKWIITSDGSSGEHVTAILYNGQVKTLMLSEHMQRWHDGSFKVFIQPK